MNATKITEAPRIAVGRKESDQCQRGTTGCCIDHDGFAYLFDRCETW